MKRPGDSPVNKAIFIAHFIEPTENPASPTQLPAHLPIPPEEPLPSPKPAPTSFAFSIINDQYYIAGKDDAGFGDILCAAEELSDPEAAELESTSESGTEPPTEAVAVVDLSGYHIPQ